MLNDMSASDEPQAVFSGDLRAGPAYPRGGASVNAPHLRLVRNEGDEATPREVAEQLQRNSYRPVVLLEGSKRPLHNDWRNREPNFGDWQNGRGVGVLGGYRGLVPIDIDTRDAKIVEAIMAALPKPLVTVKGRRGVKLFYQDRTGLITKGRKFRDRESGMLCEVLTTGQAVVPPTLHPEIGKPFRYTSAATLLDTSVDELPAITPQHIEALEAALAPWLAPRRDETANQGKKKSKPSTKRMKEYALAALRKEVEALALMKKDTGRNYAMYQSVCKLGKYVNGDILQESQLVDALLQACKANGLWEDDGETQCRATITSGLHKSLGDELPELEEREQPSNKQKVKEGLGLISICASDIPATPIDWLWENRLAIGKTAAFAGEPCAGKSQLLLDIIARITTGSLWPNNEGRAPLGSAILFTSEDGLADTVIPRLMAAGADLSRVHIIPAVRTVDGNRGFVLQVDLKMLEELITKIGDVVVVGFDPLASYMPGVNSSQNSDVRSVLDRISEVAERRRVAVVSIMHFRKEASGKTTSKASHRVLDSVAFVASPRLAYVVSEDPNVQGQSRFLPIQFNLTERPLGLSYSIVGKIVQTSKGPTKTSHIEWGSQPINMTADQALAEDARSAARSSTSAAILRVLKEADGDEGMTPAEVAAELEMDRNTVKQRMSYMKNHNHIHSLGNGRYCHLDHVPPQPQPKPRKTSTKKHKVD